MILVVDDEPQVLEVIVEGLALRGHVVCSAGCGEDALAHIWDFREIHTLVTDINMPGMTGIELAKEARERRGDMNIVLVSGRPFDGVFTPSFLRELGAVALRKPFRIVELEAAIELARRELVERRY